MKSFWKMFLAVVLGQIVLILIVIAIIASQTQEKVEVQSGSVLVQEITGEIPEAPPTTEFPFPGMLPSPSHTAILENLEKARHDNRVKAVVLRLGMPSIGYAKQAELRERIAQLRKAGKPVWAYTEMLGRTELYLGAACDSLFLMPTGYVMLHGMAAGRPYLAGTLEKLEIKQDIHRIGAYKSAAEMVQRKSMSPEARDNLSWIFDDVYPAITGTIEVERKVPAGTMEEAFAAGALSAAQVAERKLVDRLVYWDEVEERLLALPGVERAKSEGEGTPARPRTISGGEYTTIKRADVIKAKKKIAVVHATGMIAGEESGFSFPFGATMGAQTMAEAFRNAAADKNIEAIVYRVDSGGGESSTSWKIQRAASIAAQTKPIVVSMVDRAASGGYLICYPFEPLVANSLSIVGSIGSISGKMNLRDFYADKLGITWDFVTRGPNALMESEVTDYTPDQWRAFTANHWNDYYEWVADIGRARNMTVAEVDSLGRGRVFTGDQALEKHLIDQVGGFDEAVRLAKERAGIAADEEVDFVHFPRKKSFFETLRSQGVSMAFNTIISELLRPWRGTAASQQHGTWAIDWTQYR